MKFRPYAKRALSAALALAVMMLCAVQSPQNTVTFATESEEYQQKLNDIAKKQEELADKISGMQGDIDKQSEQKALVESQISTATEKINLISDYMGSVAESMEELEAKIAETSKLIEEKKQSIDEGVKNFKQRLRTLYLAGNSSYMSVIIGSGDFYDMLMKIELISRVAEHDNDALDALTKQMEDYKAQQELLNSQKKELLAKQEDYEKQKQVLSDEMQSLNELYNQTSQELSNLEAMKNEYLSKKSEYDAQQNAFEAQLQEAIRKNAAKVTTAAQTTTAVQTTTTPKQTTQVTTTPKAQPTTTVKKTTVKTTTTTKKTTTTTQKPPSSNFMWPCPGYYLITSDYGSRWGSFHSGIDVGDGGIGGANIIASRGGTVIMANNSCTHNYGKSASCGCGWGYGNYCIIDHGDGYQTVYAHMSNCNVSEGQTVSQGQVIGTVGSTGWSTGDHLHFEIRSNGTAVSPWNFF